MLTKFNRKNIIFIVVLALWQFVLYIVKNILIDVHASNQIIALEIVFYFFVFPGLLGVLLKLIINNKSSAAFVLGLSIMISCICIAMVDNSGGNAFCIELFVQILTVPITVIYYFAAFLIIKTEKKLMSSIITIVISLIFAIVFLGLNLLFLTLAH